MYFLLSSEQGPRLCLGEVIGTVIVDQKLVETVTRRSSCSNDF